MWIVEWSESQGWFHIGNVDQMIGKNMLSYIGGRETNYAIVGITESEDEAAELIQFLKERREAPLPDQAPDEVVLANKAVEIVTAKQEPLPPDDLADLAMFADSVFELAPPKQQPPSHDQQQKNKEPLSSAARRNGLETVPLNDGREIIPYKRR